MADRVDESTEITWRDLLANASPEEVLELAIAEVRDANRRLRAAFPEVFGDA